jgi:hypothetical protein
MTRRRITYPELTLANLKAHLRVPRHADFHHKTALKLVQPSDILYYGGLAHSQRAQESSSRQVGLRGGHVSVVAHPRCQNGQGCDLSYRFVTIPQQTDLI